jgi:C4-dicarboxylate transporter DctQ subunit
MKAKSGVLRALRILDGILREFERYVLIAATILATIMLIAGVVARTVIQHSFTFTEEVAGFFIVSMTFVGIAYGARVGRHIRMSAVYDLMPIKVRRVMMIIINFITFAVLVLLTIFAVQYFLRVHETKVLSPALRYPRAILVGFAALGLFLGAVEYLKNFIFNLLTIKEPDVYVSTEKKDIGYDV